MITKIDIEGFKNIKSQEFDIKPLTILTGLNSTGKSTLIQAILLFSSLSANSINKSSLILSDYIKLFGNFNNLRNKYQKSEEIKITLSFENKDYQLKITSESREIEKNAILPFEEKLFYISANRIGLEDIANFDDEIKFGVDGKYVFSYFDINKDKPIYDLLIKDTISKTLDTQLSFWLKHILDIDLRLKTEKVTFSNIKVSYNVGKGKEELIDLSPFNLGTGNSYLAKILIIGLSCKKGDIFIVENPEIHLHPKAQAKIANFFSFLATNGVEVIVETHSEHFINKIRHNIYKNHISDDEVVIYYKNDIQNDFEKILIDRNGHFINEKSDFIEFPSGFFDSTLKELLEIM